MGRICIHVNIIFEVASVSWKLSLLARKMRLVCSVSGNSEHQLLISYTSFEERLLLLSAIEGVDFAVFCGVLLSLSRV